MSGASQIHAPTLARESDFSLVLGGPLFQLLRRAHLDDGGLHLLRRRILVLALVPWLPLLVLAAIEGTAIGAQVAVPLVHDIETHVRFLVAVPALVIAEVVVHQRLRIVAQEFVDRELIPDAERARFDAALASAMRLRNSVIAEVVLLAIVYVFGIQYVWREHMVLPTASWYATPGPGGTTLTVAGMWFAYVSLPIFQFLLLRWYWRILIWFRLTWQLSRIEYRLVPSHPDHAAGLGFLEISVIAFAPLAFAHGALFAGSIFERIQHAGASLPEFRYEALALVLYMFALAIGPLLAFMPQLRRARLRGDIEYGILAQRYVRQFEDKWLGGNREPGEALVGSADIQSLADLNTSVEAVHAMRLVPVGKNSIVQIGVAVILPIVPLFLTVMPLDALLKRLAGIAL